MYAYSLLRLTAAFHRFIILLLFFWSWILKCMISESGPLVGGCCTPSARNIQEFQSETCHHARWLLHSATIALRSPSMLMRCKCCLAQRVTSEGRQWFFVSGASLVTFKMKRWWTSHKTGSFVFSWRVWSIPVVERNLRAAPVRPWISKMLFWKGSLYLNSWWKRI